MIERFYLYVLCFMFILIFVIDMIMVLIYIVKLDKVLNYIFFFSNDFFMLYKLFLK